MKKILNVQISHNRINRILRMNKTHYFEKIFKKLYIKTNKHKFTKHLINNYNSLRFVNLEN